MAENNAIFENIIGQVENGLVNQTFQIRNNRQLEITPNHFNAWKKIITTQLLPLHNDNGFDLNKLQMIIVCSSGVKNFNDVTAMIPRHNPPRYIPPTVQNLIRSLFHAFAVDENGRQRYELIDPTDNNNLRNSFYDYGCGQLRESVFFINVCLVVGSNNEDADMLNAVLSIRFINELLNWAAGTENKRKVALLDFRLTQHKHKDNFSENFPNENEFRNLLQENEVFRIVNPNNDEYYCFCHPMQLPIPNARFTELFREIHRNGYPIKRMYRPPNEEW